VAFEKLKNMKKLIVLLFCAIAFACEEDQKIIDPVFEFVSINGNESADLNESSNSEAGYPISVQLWAAQPYATDIDLTFQAIGTNATSGTDFNFPATTLKIEAGRLVSDTIWITTINNETQSTAERKVEVRLTSVSQSGIKIGLGIDNPTHDAILFTIVDDECSTPLSIFNSALTNTINWGGDDVLKSATGALDGNQFSVSGNLIDYGTFPGASLTLTLTPEFTGATKGSATFGEFESGTDNDGYEYKFVQTGNGIYDVCAGTITVAYDIYYLSGGSWVYWYSVTNTFSPTE
jgi:hypothetical protein